MCLSMDLKYFKEEEFARCSPPCSMSQVSERLLYKLDAARELYGKPIIVNSAYRSVDYEKQHGRDGTSSHCLGEAVDVRCANSFDRLLLLIVFLCVGFRRIGIGKTFIHIDLDENKPSAVWLY